MNRCVVMIHGMWAGPWCWADYRALFEADGWHCVVPPLPCHDSDTCAAPDSRLVRLSLLDCADAPAAQITAVGERPIVIGHSMSGLLAQMLAARGLARAAVLPAPAVPAGMWAIGPSVVRSFWGILTTWAFWRKPVRQTFDAASHSSLHRLPPDERRHVYGSFGPESRRVVLEIGLSLLDALRCELYSALPVRRDWHETFARGAASSDAFTPAVGAALVRPCRVPATADGTA